MTQKILNVKNILRIIISVLIIFSILKSCAKAWTWEDFINYSQQLKDDTSYTNAAKRTASYMIGNYNSIIAKLGTLGVSPATYDNFIGATQSSTNPYYYNFFMYNGGTTNISSTGKITVTNCTGKFLRYDSRNGYSWCIDITNSHIDYNYTYYYGLVNTSSLIPDFVYLQNKFVSPNHLQFEANADIVTNYNSYNNVNVKKGSYTLNSWLLGEITEYLNGYDYYRFIVYDQSGNVVLENLYNGIYDANTSGALFLDKEENKLFVKSSWLYYKQVYTLAIYPEDYQGNKAEENIVETYVFLPLNAVFSGDSIVSTGSGDYTTQDSTNEIVGTISNLFTLSNNDIEDLRQQMSGDLQLAQKAPVGQEISLLEGIENVEIGDFVISWSSVAYTDKNTQTPIEIIPSGEINFSQKVRENEALGTVHNYLRIIMTGAIGYLIIYEYWRIICIALGIGTALYDNYEEENRIITTEHENYNENTGTMTRTITKRKGNKSASITRRSR